MFTQSFRPAALFVVPSGRAATPFTQSRVMGFYLQAAIHVGIIWPGVAAKRQAMVPQGPQKAPQAFALKNKIP
jgi:hypothetical protein